MQAISWVGLERGMLGKETEKGGTDFKGGFLGELKPGYCSVAWMQDSHCPSLEGS